MRRRARFGFLTLLALGTGVTARAEPPAPVLHEPIPPNPREDVSFDLALDGEIPAAIQTPRGLVEAPDPRRPVDGEEHSYGSNAPTDVPGSSFRPDRDTRRPDMLPYDDPFTPSTAPFKRLAAFDTVDASYTLSVRAPHLEPLTVAASAPLGPADAIFYADMVVDLSSDEPVRIPSVGPGARVLRARAGVGSEDVPITLARDGAENWFVSANVTRRVRLVMELSIPRTAFGGDYGDPAWSELPRVGALPTRVARAARKVAEKIGVDGRGSPRDKVTKLVAYFRAFEDSDDPPTPSDDIYLDLALSKKGVCRHRAFAFLVTALGVGIPTRVVVNEAHAWVEVHDGRAWRRIDLGGAGRALERPRATASRFDPPPDAFAWPHRSARGDELANRGASVGANGANGANARNPTGMASNAPSAPNAPNAPSTSNAPDTANGDPTAPPKAAPNGAASATTANSATNGAASANPAASANGTGANSAAAEPPDARPASTIALELAAKDVQRGSTLRVTGHVSAENRPCERVPVSFFLHGRDGADAVLGQLATDDQGAFDGVVRLPPGLELGDYELRARTSGGARCGTGGTR